MNDPTPEQAAIIDFARSSPQNLVVNALAGTGKTSTIEMVCNAVRNTPILYLAFNKRIVDEAKGRMPGHVECKTQNALGHAVWQQACGRRLVVDGGKTRSILRALINELKGAAKDAAWDGFSDTLRWISRAKRDGYVPARFTGPAPGAIWRDAKAWYRGDPPDFPRLIDETLIRSIAQAHEGGIDYDDQIYMPVVFGGPWPKFPFVIIDEAQDMNELQHEMLDKLVVKRLMAVGDPWQSIYAFRGAISNGMTALTERFDAHTLPLSVTFRVPKSGVLRAQSRVPHYRAFEANPEGEILELPEWSATDIPTEAAIICRNNAPLISMAFKLLRSGRAIKLVGMDIGAGLVRILKRLPSGPMPDAIDAWRGAELARGQSASVVWDKAECLRALCAGKSSLQDAITQAELLFKREGPIQLLSGHKAKGLEWDTVFHLDPWRIPSRFAVEGSEEWEQELNVRYVVETRWKQRLVLVDGEGWMG
jgi:DNA helicase-2/ATP-dependent DNA helicase PcrA